MLLKWDKMKKIILLIMISLIMGGCVQGMGGINNTLSNFDSIIYSTHDISVSTVNGIDITHKGVKYDVTRSGKFSVDDDSYNICNTTGGYIKTPFGFVNSSKLHIGDFKFF